MKLMRLGDDIRATESMFEHALRGTHYSLSSSSPAYPLGGSCPHGMLESCSLDKEVFGVGQG